MAHVTIPNTLTANTLAQASQVMANLQAIVTQVNGNLDSTNLKDGAVTEGKVAAAAINTTELADEAVTNAKMAAAAVDTANLVDDAVTADKVAADAVNTEQIVDDAVTIDKMAANSVDTEQLVDGAVTSAKLASGAALANLDANSVTPVKTSFFTNMLSSLKVYVTQLGPGTISDDLPGSWTFSKPATGRYRIDFGSSKTRHVFAMPNGDGDIIVACVRSSTVVDFYMRELTGTGISTSISGVNATLDVLIFEQ